MRRKPAVCAIPHLKQLLSDSSIERFHFTITTALAETGATEGLQRLTGPSLQPRYYSPYFVWKSLPRCPGNKCDRTFKNLLPSAEYELQAINCFF